MTKLTKYYVSAIMKNHPRAVYITAKLDQSRRDLAAIGVDLSEETMRTMAQDAWAMYAESVNNFEPKEL